MHQIVCRLGLCPRPTEGSYIAPPDPLAGLGVGPTGNGKEGGEGKRRKGREGTGRKGRASRNECPNPELASLATVFFSLCNINTVLVVIQSSI